MGKVTPDVKAGLGPENRKKLNLKGLQPEKGRGGSRTNGGRIVGIGVNKEGSSLNFQIFMIVKGEDDNRTRPSFRSVHLQAQEGGEIMRRKVDPLKDCGGGEGSTGKAHRG